MTGEIQKDFEKEKVFEVFKSIGLSKNEIEVYLSLIQSGLSSALSLSSKTGIHRSNVYDSLRSLGDKGFVKEMTIEGKKNFQAVDPSKIKNYIRQKEQEFDMILPGLKDYSSALATSNNISMSQGSFAARQALLDLLLLNSPINVYGASKEAVDTFGTGFLTEYHKKRKSLKIQMNHIYNKSAYDRIKYLNKLEYTEARFISKKYDTLAATVVCKDTVLLLIFSKPAIVITIKNPEVGDAYNKYFQVLWKYAKK